LAEPSPLADDWSVLETDEIILQLVSHEVVWEIIIYQHFPRAIAESSVFIFSKLFVWHSSGENVRMKENKAIVRSWKDFW